VKKNHELSRRSARGKKKRKKVRPAACTRMSLRDSRGDWFLFYPERGEGKKKIRGIRPPSSRKTHLILDRLARKKKRDSDAFLNSRKEERGKERGKKGPISTPESRSLPFPLEQTGYRISWSKGKKRKENINASRSSRHAGEPLLELSEKGGGGGGRKKKGEGAPLFTRSAASRGEREKRPARPWPTNKTPPNRLMLRWIKRKERKKRRVPASWGHKTLSSPRRAIGRKKAESFSPREREKRTSGERWK